MTIAPATMPLYVCAQFYLVDVVYARVVEQPTLVERQFAGVEPGQRIERVYRAVWPHDRFTRDDIDDEEVQRGFISVKVGTVSRVFYRTDSTTLLFHKGHLRVAVPGQSHDPYCAGLTWSYLTAAMWVATGKAPLLTPWAAQ